MTESNKPILTSGMFTSRTEEWETPQYVFDALNEEFHFSLDVCATPENTKVAHNYLTKEENGLLKQWYGMTARSVCWMNPPYGKEIYLWMKKAYEESVAGATVVCLVPARTDTRWWYDWAMKADEIRLIKGRLKFGDGKQSAPFPSCVVVFRKTNKKEPTFTSIVLTAQKYSESK